MKKFLYLVISICLFLSLMAPSPIFAYPLPPTTIIIQFDINKSELPAIVDKSGIGEALIGKMEINVSGSGSFSKTVNIPISTIFKSSDFAGGTPADGTFTMTGTYRKGYITADWNLELYIPVRKSWKFDDTYTGKGTFYTTVPMSDASGTGVVDGEMSRTYTKWKDDKMVDHTNLTETANFSKTFTMYPSCPEVICGCEELPDAYDSQARFKSLTNQVSYAHCNSSEKAQDWTPASPKTILLVGDHVATGEDSQAIFQFKDMTTFQMKPDTEVIVKSPPEQQTKIGLVAGHLWINTKKMFTNGTMEVEMGQAVAGIKGTTLVLDEVEGVSTLKVIEGVVSFTSKATGKSTDVNAGEQISANFEGTTPVEKFDVAKETANWKTLEEINKPSGMSVIVIIAIVIGSILIIAGLVFFFLRRKKKNKLIV